MIDVFAECAVAFGANDLHFDHVALEHSRHERPFRFTHAT